MSAETSSPPPAYHPEHLGPYLTLRHRISLAPFAYPIIAISFVAFRLWLAAETAQRLVDNAKALLIAACLSAEKAATSVVSLPRWLAQGSNEQLTRAAIGTIEASASGLDLILTALEHIIIFVIDTYKGFYLCLFQLAIQGSLAGVRTIVEFVESSFDDFATFISGAAASAQSGLNSVIGTVNTGLSVVGMSVQIPRLEVATSPLSDFTIPNTMSTTLAEFNDRIPTLDELRAALADLIGRPFELLKAEINSTLSDAASGLQVDLLPVPALRTVEFCADVDLSPVDNVGAKLVKIAQTAAIIVTVLIFVAMVANCLIEWWRWRSVQKTMDAVREGWTDPSGPADGALPAVQLTNENILTIYAQMEQGFGYRFASKVASIFHLHPNTRDSLAWFIAYITYPPALMVLLIGVLGIIVVLVQLTLIKPLEDEFSNLGDIIVGNFTERIAEEINAAIDIDSAAYAAEVNGFMDSASYTLDQQVFGFARTASGAIDNTVIEFYHDMEDGIRRTFDGTVLGQSVVELLRCVIGNKILALETALEWIEANLHVRLPHVDPDVLKISGSSVSEMAGPVGAAASSGGDGSGDGSGETESSILSHVFEAYRDLLWGEFWLFIAFLGLYGVVVVSALILLVWHKATGSARTEGGDEKQAH